MTSLMRRLTHGRPHANGPLRLHRELHSHAHSHHPAHDGAESQHQRRGHSHTQRNQRPPRPEHRFPLPHPLTDRRKTFLFMLPSWSTSKAAISPKQFPTMRSAFAFFRSFLLLFSTHSAFTTSMFSSSSCMSTNAQNPPSPTRGRHTSPIWTGVRRTSP